MQTHGIASGRLQWNRWARHMHWRQFGGVWSSSSVIELWWWIIIEGETAKRELDGTDSYSFTQIKGVKGWKMKDSTSYQIIALRLAGPNQSSDRTGFIPMGNDTPMTCFQRRSPSTVRAEFSLREISPLNFTSTEQGGGSSWKSTVDYFRFSGGWNWRIGFHQLWNSLASRLLPVKRFPFEVKLDFLFFCLQKSKRGKSTALLLMKNYAAHLLNAQHQ